MASVGPPQGIWEAWGESRVGQQIIVVNGVSYKDNSKSNVESVLEALLKG